MAAYTDRWKGLDINGTASGILMMMLVDAA
jgi:hypothetical protein